MAENLDWSLLIMPVNSDSKVSIAISCVLEDQGFQSTYYLSPLDVSLNWLIRASLGCKVLRVKVT